MKDVYDPEGQEANESQNNLRGHKAAAVFCFWLPTLVLIQCLPSAPGPNKDLGTSSHLHMPYREIGVIGWAVLGCVFNS